MANPSANPLGSSTVHKQTGAVGSKSNTPGCSLTLAINKHGDSVTISAVASVVVSAR